MFGLWKRVRDGTLTRRGFKTLMQPIRQSVEALLLRGAFSGNRLFAGMCDELWKGRDFALDDLVTVGRRARLQLTQAVASLVVHEVGLELRRRASSSGDSRLDRLVDELRVGVVRPSTAR